MKSDARTNRQVHWAWLSLLVTAICLLCVVWLVSQNAVQHNPVMDRMTPWLLARAGGVASYVLLLTLVLVGMLLASVPNKESWRFSKFFLPFHRLLSLFLIAFLILHILSIVLDIYVKVGWLGAFIPLFSIYRPIPVALGTVALYAILLLAVTARFPRLLPSGRWLTVHRVALATFWLAFLHGVLTGTDSPQLSLLYDGSAVAVCLLALIRYAIVSAKKQLRSGNS